MIRLFHSTLVSIMINWTCRVWACHTMYSRVPRRVTGRSTFRSMASPKSASLSVPSDVSRMFSGLMSRCMMPYHVTSACSKGASRSETQPSSVQRKLNQLYWLSRSMACRCNVCLCVLRGTYPAMEVLQDAQEARHHLLHYRLLAAAALDLDLAEQVAAIGKLLHQVHVALVRPCRVQLDDVVVLQVDLDVDLPLHLGPAA